MKFEIENNTERKIIFTLVHSENGSIVLNAAEPATGESWNIITISPNGEIRVIKTMFGDFLFSYMP